MNPRIYVGALDEATFTMSEAENSSYPLSNLSTYNASDQWRSSTSTNGQSLKIDFGSARPRDFCIIENHNFSGLTTVSLQAADSSDYATNLTTVVTSLVGSANSPLKFEFTAVSKRYWRILFTTLGGTAPQLGQIFIDQKVEFSQSFDFGFRPKNEDFESVVRKVAMSGLERAAKTYSGRLRFEMGWNNVNNTTLELLRWWMQKVSGGFAPFWYFDELNYSFYVRCGKNFNPATVNAYKINGIATISLQSVSVGQNPYTMQTSAMALDLDGSTEYASKSSPLNLDMNGSEQALNTGFETDLTNWGDDGNHVLSRINTDSHAGTWCGECVASGAGVATTDRIFFLTNQIESNKKYTVEIWAKSVSGNTTLTLRENQSAQQTSFTLTASWAKYVWNFTLTEQTTAFVLFLAGAGTFRVDDVSVTEAYDFTILAWVKSSSATYQSITNKSTASNSRDWDFGINGATNNFLVCDIADGVTEVNLAATSGDVKDGNWHLAAFTADRDGNLAICADGNSVATPSSIASIGKLGLSTPLYVGERGWAAALFNGQIGEVQVIRGYAMTAAQILQIYNTAGILKAYDSTNFPNAEVVAHYRFRGTSDTDFLKDETGYNNLTGTNLTQVLDQVTATYRIAEL